MATIEERLTAALEQIASISAQRESPLKEIQYIPEFSGETHKLSQFISIVETHLKTKTAEQRTTAWLTIYNVKIAGRAKELLLNNTVTSWEQARTLLTQHFRPHMNVKDITRKINSLKVGTIIELNIKIEQLIGDVNSLVLYEAERENLRNILYSSIVLKIKDLVTGSLSRELRNVYDLHRIKEILYTYVGSDENLDHKNYNNMNRNNPPKPKPVPNHSQNHSNGNNNFNNRPDQFRENGQNSGRSRNNPFNPSGQFRNAVQNPQPMEIDNIHETEETNNNIEQDFFLN